MRPRSFEEKTMLSHLQIENVLFLDIETVPAYPSYQLMSPEERALWDHKASFLSTTNPEPAALYERAGIYAEFGKIICISSGCFVKADHDQRTFRIKSFFGDDECSLLEEFAGMLNAFSAKSDITLCAHNGKEFDFPYLSRRMLIHRMRLPELLDNAGKKPWEVKLADTMELWKFGDYKHYTSLALLSHVFGLPAPKKDLDGSRVASVYYLEHDIHRIVEYCEEDVLALTRVFLRFKGVDGIFQTERTRAYPVENRNPV